MNTTDPDDLERVDQEIRINELKAEAEELTGGEMVNWESEECPPGIAEQFWRNGVEYDKAPWTSHYEQLTAAGLELPPPEKLNDQQLSTKLWELIHRLAEMRVFFCSTDHLSDRELYTHLVEESLHEAIKEMPFDTDGAWTVDLVSGGSAEDTHLYLKHYADEDSRRHWVESFPGEPIPAHEDPPFDRDRHLPQPTYGEPREEEGEDEDESEE